MAIVHQYTIIYFTLIVHESMFISINRDLCLKTVERFISHKHKCNFDLSTALDILQDVTTCPKKCSVLMNDLSCDDKHSLGGIDLKIGKWKEKERIYYCSKSYPWTFLSVNCSSWNSKESIVRTGWYDANRCFKNNAQCVIIEYYCICHCLAGYILVDKKCLKKLVNIGGICEFDRQCNGTTLANVCDHYHGVCSCSPGYIKIDRKSYPDYPNSIGIGSSISQQHDINIGVTLGLLFGGFILGVIVTAVVTNLMYRRLIFRTRKRKEPDVMFSGNRTYGGASTQILYRNNKKRDVSKLSPYSFAKETPGYNSSENQDERSDDVYNHLHEQTEQVDDTYDHACAVPIHNTDLSDYSNIHDAAIFRLSPSKDGDDYSTLRH